MLCESPGLQPFKSLWHVYSLFRFKKKKSFPHLAKQKQNEWNAKLHLEIQTLAGLAELGKKLNSFWGSSIQKNT